MTALAVIGWAFIAGLAVVAFITPIYIADVISKRAAHRKDEETPK